MPAPGDQHNTAWKNPYEEVKPRVSSWTAKEIATIASRLDKQLGPEYISSRAGPGGSRVHYLTAEKCINLANEVFGFNGWSSSIQNIQVDFADENPTTQRVSIGLSVIVRVTLRDGSYHEDVGYGSIENARGKAMAFEKAKKEGTTDALKRALRNFGSVLGNCVYDKEYVNQVTKMKAQPVKRFDGGNLHRHPDFVAVKEENLQQKQPVLGEVPAVSKSLGASGGGSGSGSGSGNASATTAMGQFVTDPGESFDDFLGELDEADFCVPDDGHPDEVLLPTLPPPLNNHHNNNQNNNSSNNAGNTPRTPKPPQFQPPPPPPPPAAGEPIAFFSARSTLALAEGPAHHQKHLFNPRAESPSIRKTPGIDHSTSKPLARNGQHVAPSSSQAPANTATPSLSTSLSTPNANANANSASNLSSTPSRPVSRAQQGPGAGAGAGGSGTMNPPLEQARRIGAPGAGMASPLSNRGQYKPPTMKRALPPEGRAPLADVPNASKNASLNAPPVAGDGLDVKRQKMA